MSGRRRGGGGGSRAPSTRSCRRSRVGGRGRSASPGAASARRRPCRRRRVGDGPAPTRVGRRRRSSEVATANAGRAVRGASWSSRDGAVLSQRETSAAPVGGHDARRACSLSVMGNLRGRSRVSKAVDTMGANFRSPAAASSPIRARTCHLRHAGPTRRTGGHAGATRRRVSSACPAAPLHVQESLLRCNWATRSPQAPPRPPRCRGSPLGRLGDPPQWGPVAGPPAASRLTGNEGIAEAVRSHNGFTEGRKPAVPTRAVRRRLRARLRRGDAPATQKRAEVWH